MNLIDDDDDDDVPHPLANVIANKLYKRDVRDLFADDAKVEINITEVSFFLIQLEYKFQHIVIRIWMVMRLAGRNVV